MKYFLFYMFFSITLLPCLYAEETTFVASKTVQPYFKGPAPLNGNKFLNVVNVKPEEKCYQEIAKEPMTWGRMPSFHVPLLENSPPIYNRLMMREIRIFDKNGKNITEDARLSAGADKAELRFPERIMDGDLSAQSCAYTYPPRRGEDQRGWFDFEFPATEEISSVVVHSGRPRIDEGEEYINLASSFSVLAEEAGSWREIPGALIKNNNQPEYTVTFSPIKTQKLRVLVHGQTTLGKVSAKHLENLKSIPTDNTPFLVSMRGANVWTSFTDAIVDNQSYQKWKSAHPNFLGFSITEWDNSYRTLLLAKDIRELLKRHGISSKNAEIIQKQIVQPKTRAEALANLKMIHGGLTRLHFGDASKITYLDCAMALSHYAMEWGCGYTFIETTCAGYQRHQPQMYFIRGASRQYGIPWGWYIAVGMNGDKGYTDPDYIGTWSCNAAGSDGGTSPSLNLRDRFLAWFSGAEMVRNEVWPWAYCMDTDKDGIYELSPHGEAMKTWYSFILKNPDRGVSYAPVAIAVPYEHGISPIQGGKPFGIFPYTRGDIMTEGTLRAIVPWMMHKIREKPQEWAYCGSPYGDIYDVIIPAPPSGPVRLDIIKNYRAFFMNGDFDPDQPLANRLIEYVHGGGTLIINTRQLGKFFPDSFLGVRLTGKTLPVAKDIFSASGENLFSLQRPYEFDQIELISGKAILKDSLGNIMASTHNYGAGRVILTTPCMLIHQAAPAGIAQHAPWPEFPFINWILDNLVQDLVPVAFDRKDMQFGLNILKDGWLLYLFNNEGVHKTATTPEKLDPAETRTVTVALRDLKVDHVTDLRTEKSIPIDKASNTFKLVIGPGDVGVVKIQSGEPK